MLDEEVSDEFGFVAEDGVPVKGAQDTYRNFVGKNTTRVSLGRCCSYSRRTYLRRHDWGLKLILGCILVGKEAIKPRTSAYSPRRILRSSALPGSMW